MVISGSFGGKSWRMVNEGRTPSGINGDALIQRSVGQRFGTYAIAALDRQEPYAGLLIPLLG